MIEITLHLLELVVYRSVLLSKLITSSLMVGMQFSDSVDMFWCTMDKDIKRSVRILGGQFLSEFQILFWRMRDMYVPSARGDKVKEAAGVVMTSVRFSRRDSASGRKSANRFGGRHCPIVRLRVVCERD